MKAKYIKPEIDLELVNYSMMMVSVTTSDDEEGTEDSDFGSKYRKFDFNNAMFSNDDIDD